MPKVPFELFCENCFSSWDVLRKFFSHRRRQEVAVFAGYVRASSQGALRREEEKRTIYTLSLYHRHKKLGDKLLLKKRYKKCLGDLKCSQNAKKNKKSLKVSFKAIFNAHFNSVVSK